MAYLIVCGWGQDGRGPAIREEETEAEAIASLARIKQEKPEAFYVVDTGFAGKPLIVDEVNKTVSVDVFSLVSTARKYKINEIDALKIKKMASFPFGGKTYQSDHDSRDNIMGSATWAAVAITGGAQAGDYRWHGGVSDFQFITSDNSRVTMDAQTVKALGEAMGMHLYNCIQNARTHKDNIELLVSGSPTATVAEIENYDITTGWPA